jgi:hypothetical protein
MNRVRTKRPVRLGRKRNEKEPMKSNVIQKAKVTNGREQQIAPAQLTRPVAPDALISKLELATRLRKSVRTIERWQNLGLLPFMKCGRTVYYSWPDVEAHLKKYSAGFSATHHQLKDDLCS